MIGHTCNYVVKQLRLIKKKYEDRIFDNKNKQQFYLYVNRALNEQNCLPKLKSKNEIVADQEAAHQFIIFLSRSGQQGRNFWVHISL